MKAKKEMTYEQLKAATIDEVKKHFVPQVEMIKKRIEYLVDQDYLERSEDKNKFLYVAWLSSAIGYIICDGIIGRELYIKNHDRYMRSTTIILGHP